MCIYFEKPFWGPFRSLGPNFNDVSFSLPKKNGIPLHCIGGSSKATIQSIFGIKKIVYFSRRIILRLTINTNNLQKNTNHVSCFQLQWNVWLEISYCYSKKQELNSQVVNIWNVFFSSQCTTFICIFCHNLLVIQICVCFFQ